MQGIQQIGALKLTSPSFENNSLIPVKHTCKGEDLSPELNIAHIPKGTVSFALIVDDPDAPNGVWDHWLLFNIPVIAVIKEGTVPQGAVQAVNSWGVVEYKGPCPPSGTHKYYFKLYALDNRIGLGEEAVKEDIEQSMGGHVLSQTQLVGLFSKE